MPTRLLCAAPFAAWLASCAPHPAPAPPAPLPVAAASTSPALRPLVHVQVLAINDLHGNLEPPQGRDGAVLVPAGDPLAKLAEPGPPGRSYARVPAGGVAYLVTHLRQLRKVNPNTVVVSAGDLTGASPLLPSLFHDEPVVVAMSLAGLDLEAVGNHDLDHGIAELTRLQAGGPAVLPDDPRLGAKSSDPKGDRFPGASFEYLAANVRGTGGGTVFPAYAIREFEGVRVAFIGMTLEGTPGVTTPAAIAGLSFANEAKTANDLLPQLRQRGVATTIILLHQGGFQGEAGTFDSCEALSGEILPVLKALDPAFRLIITGHTHQAYDCLIDGRRVTSAASNGRLITQVDLTLDPNEKRLVDVKARNVVVTRDVTPDPQITSLIARYKEKAAPVIDRVVGYVDGVFTRDPRTAHSSSCETPLGDLIADAELAATRDAGAVLALMNPGGIRTDLVGDAGSGACPVRYGAAYEVQPFGNHLVTLTLTGADLRQLLERQFGRDRPRVLSVSKGFSYRYVYDPNAHTATVDPASVRLGGVPVRDAQRYRVTVPSFLASGGDGFSALQRAAEKTEGLVDIDALTAYLGAKGAPSSPLSAATRLDRVLGNACE